MNKDEKEKLKLFFDLNGTIIYRNTHALELKGEKKIGQRFTCLRPGTIENLKKLADYYDFYIYSSMQRNNIDATVVEIFTGSGIKFVDIFDRTWNTKDPNPVQPYDTIRDMPRIWGHLEGVTPINSIVVDNEVRKVADIRYNSIIVPQITVDELKTSSTTRLDHMYTYLIELAKSEPKDVREYIKEHPYIIEEVVKGFDSLGIDKEDREVTLDFIYVDDKVVVLNNFKTRMNVIINLPLPPNFRIDKRVSFSCLILNKIPYKVEFPSP